MRTDVVVLAGGRGERFWPLSRQSRPKQVLRLLADRSLLRAAIERALHGVPVDQVWAIAPRDLADVLRREAGAVAEHRWIWETEGKNTGPAVAAAVAEILADLARSGETDRRVLILPADHWIPDEAEFWRAVHVGETIADDTGRIVTFGIPVTRPETGYGYVERGEPIEGRDVDSFVVRRFHEKPDREAAEAYRAAGTFYWNAGIFLFSARTMAEELQRHAREFAEPFARLVQELASADTGEHESATSVPRTEAARARFFAACDSVPIDRAVMERSDRVAVVAAPFEWDDLGNWASWASLGSDDGSGNRTHGEVLANDAAGNVVYSEEGGVVALIGVRDLVVVRTNDATLVCPRDRVQEIRELVRLGRASGSPRF